jgi:hypothetical protein
MRDCKLPSERVLMSLNIWNPYILKWGINLLVTKGPKQYCFIVNTIYKCFIVNCYTIVLSNWEICDRDCLVYQFILYWWKNDYFFVLLMLFVIPFKKIYVICNSNRW